MTNSWCFCIRRSLKATGSKCSKVPGLFSAAADIYLSVAPKRYHKRTDNVSTTLLSPSADLWQFCVPTAVTAQYMKTKITDTERIIIVGIITNAPRRCATHTETLESFIPTEITGTTCTDVPENDAAATVRRPQQNRFGLVWQALLHQDNTAKQFAPKCY